MSNAKNVLKSLVKECLVELLQEGIGLNSSVNSTKIQTQMLESHPTKDSSQIQRNKNQILESKKSSKSMENIISSVADNDLMKSILMDTANTTLVEQMKHDRSNLMADSSPQMDLHEGSGVDLDSMFSDSKNNWSTMAFGKVKK